MPTNPISNSYLPGIVKRTFDLMVAVLLVPAASPIILLMAVAIRIESSGNPFFVQTRIGRDGKPFSMWKMRSLFSDKFKILEWDEELQLNSFRITKVGRFLRRTKLDELPQLFHVISGKMSLVGPRPDIPEQVDQYSLQQHERLATKPGMTGIAQISGNTFLSWPVRIELDRWYIQHASLSLDLRILLRTVASIWRGESRTFDEFGALAAIENKAAIENEQVDFRPPLDDVDYLPSKQPKPLAPVE